MWLDGNYFNLPSDLYVCSIYIPHETSNVHATRGTDPYKILAEETADYQRKGMVLYIGDFNSRTGSDIEDWDFMDGPTPVPGSDQIMTLNSDLHVPNRRNADCTTNNFGKKMIKLCETLGLVILSGRTPGDFFGKLTYHGVNGSSAIDYIICSLPLFKYIQSIKVHDLDWFSDHCQVSVKFNTQHIVEWVDSIDTQPCATNIHPHSNFIWDHDNKLAFSEFVNSDESYAEMDRISNSMGGDINKTCADITNIIQSAAKQTCKLKALKSMAATKLLKTRLLINLKQISSRQN